VKHVEPAISAAASERLARFAKLLLRWNKRINLVSRADEAALWDRHISDSAQLVGLLPARTGTLIDLGTGAGLPGLVIAILTTWRVHLVESDQRKAAFLREAARETRTDVSIHVARAEALRIAPAEVVTARALGQLDRLLSLAAPLLVPGGICLFPKGRNVSEELTAAEAEWQMRVERFPSQTDPLATLLRISEIERVRHI